MQYQVDPTDQTPENGQKPLFGLFGSLKRCNFVIFEWSSISDIMAKLLTPFSLIRICNIKLTGWTKLEKMANSTPGGDLQPTRCTKNFLKNQPDFSRTCGFRGKFTERLNFQIQHSNMTNPALDFSQNRLKVKKTQKRPFFEHVFMNN